MNTSEVLDRAADEIERRGWSQGGGWFPKCDGVGPVCAEGALKLAATDADGFLQLGIKGRAYGALVAYLHDRYPECINPTSGRVIPFSWNDWPGRTVEEVVEALRAAAAIEQSHEAARIEARA